MTITSILIDISLADHDF